MKKYTVTILAVLLVAFGPISIHAQNRQAASTNRAAQQKAQPVAQTKIDPAKEADIRKLLDITGAKTIASQSMDAMLMNIKPLLADSLPPGEYRVTVVANEDPAPPPKPSVAPTPGKRITPARYGSPKSTELAFTVKPGGNTIHLPLKSK